ncbi:hypothetical protein ACMD2_21620 [Ananas comosus]|uniref:Uncharacterized protein n=1 Tax=Ananas comosus TaxID=4615 RepID=A0A199UT50_ANACO|nr:hypothetical protein ACMD2_21620 [Ananas comosus]
MSMLFMSIFTSVFMHYRVWHWHLCK